MWALKGGDSARIKEHAVEALNFQISALIYFTIATVLCLVLIGFLMLAVLVPFYLVCPVVAATRAAAGRSFRYPLTLRLVS